MEPVLVADWLWLRHPRLKEAGKIRVCSVACWGMAKVEPEAEVLCEHYVVQVLIPSFGGSVAGERYVHLLFSAGGAGAALWMHGAAGVVWRRGAGGRW